MYYQQGDVLLKKINEIPGGARPVAPPDGRLILAEGEVTGHAHAIQVQEGVDLMTLADALFLKVGVPVTVTHEEHNPVTIAPGTYQVEIVREYDHFAEEAQRVVD